MEKISYKLPLFEGPLDLLLYLIGRNKLNIHDIPIAELLDQYMAHVDAMREADLDIASEFLEMAARLVHIKTVALLPRTEQDADPRAELTGQLLEYQAVQEAARRLMREGAGFNSFVREPLTIPQNQSYGGRHQPQELRDAYIAASGRGKRRIPPPVSVFTQVISRQVVSVSTKIVYVLRRLWGGKHVPFANLFETAHSKSELVATFLAVLELVKGKRVQICAPHTGEEILLMVDGEGRWN